MNPELVEQFKEELDKHTVRALSILENIAESFKEVEFEIKCLPLRRD